MAKKMRLYEVVSGGHKRGGSCFVIREVEVNKLRGWIAGSWSLSAADEKAVRNLVAQANLAVPKEGV